jgi:hypothetical protein
MQVSQILSEIDREIDRLRQARNLLAGDATVTRRGGGSLSKAVKKGSGTRRLSAEGRRKISLALKARWAERKRAAAKASK